MMFFFSRRRPLNETLSAVYVLPCRLKRRKDEAGCREEENIRYRCSKGNESFIAAAMMFINHSLQRMSKSTSTVCIICHDDRVS